MTNAERDKAVTFLSAVGLFAFLVGFAAVMYIVDQDGFGPAPVVQPTPKREIVTVYCLGLKVQPIYCKNLNVLYGKFTNNN